MRELRAGEARGAGIRVDISGHQTGGWLAVADRVRCCIPLIHAHLIPIHRMGPCAALIRGWMRRQGHAAARAEGLRRVWWA